MKFTFERLHYPGNNSQKVIYYDAMCNLCLKSIEFIRRKEKVKSIAFIPLQASEFKNEAAASLLFKENNHMYTRSDAVLRIARYLRWPYSLFYYLWIIPRFVRDYLYDLVARNRYRWFGRCEACEVKT